MRCCCAAAATLPSLDRSTICCVGVGLGEELHLEGPGSTQLIIRQPLSGRLGGGEREECKRTNERPSHGGNSKRRLKCVRIPGPKRALIASGGDEEGSGLVGWLVWTWVVGMASVWLWRWHWHSGTGERHCREIFADLQLAVGGSTAAGAQHPPMRSHTDPEGASASINQHCSACWAWACSPCWLH